MKLDLVNFIPLLLDDSSTEYGLRLPRTAFARTRTADAPEGDGKPRTAPAAAPSLPRQTDTQLDRTQEATGGASSVRLRSLVTRTREAHSARTCAFDEGQERTATASSGHVWDCSKLLCRSSGETDSSRGLRNDQIAVHAS